VKHPPTARPFLEGRTHGRLPPRGSAPERDARPGEQRPIHDDGSSNSIAFDVEEWVSLKPIEVLKMVTLQFVPLRSPNSTMNTG
jgi:hypothetical protein